MHPLLEIKGLSMPMLGGGGGLVDKCTSDTCGGGLVDEEACDTFEGEGVGGGGGRSMGDTNGLGGGVGRKISMGRSSNVASGDAWSDE